MTQIAPRTHEEIAARLAELEATFDAIRHGEVDALVVEGERGREIYSLSTADEAYRVLVESLGEGALTASADGIILYANASMAAMLGASAEELLGRKLDDRLGPAGTRTAQQVAQAVLSADRPTLIEATLVGGPRAQAALPVLLSVSPIRHSGPVRVALTATDLTDIKRTHKTLESLVAERTKALAAANAELEAFTSSVSHDLRAPLRSILAFTAAILADHAGALPQDALADIRRTRAAAAHMNALVDDLLRLSVAGRAPLQIGAVDLSALATVAVAALREGEPDRDVAVTIQPGLRASGDATLLTSVLTNLVGNAWKFTSLRKKATIEVAMATTLRGNAFFVRDNGAGFDPAFAGKLFIPFQRLHSTAEFPGTGIGLATVKRIVARHGGDVWAEGEPGKGATFYFTLPGKDPP